MFDLFAMLLSSIASFLFPIFASYKALKTSDPAQLTPWLMYWVVFSICLLIESWFSFILFWVPFYGYIRLLFFLYLILPQTQGARVLYEDKVHPFLRDNEYAIDDFIASAHHRLKNAGLAYFRRAVDYIKTNLLNLPPTEQRATPAAESASSAFLAPQGYTQSLLARFSVPTARWSGAAGTGMGMGNDFYSLLANAVSATTNAGGGGSGAAPSSSSATLVPPHLRGSAEKMDFITAQRERLNIVLNALDREAQQMQADGSSRSSSRNNTPGGVEEPSQRPPSGMSMFSGLSKSRSETDFEKVEAESGAEDEVTLRRRQASAGAGAGAGAGPGAASSWMPWGWSTTGAEGGGVYASRKQD
ncbi:hypothetical protein E4U13_007403 [Claviceps humidiphila]|uniref:Protein YOP1 n=1 Tax=Claviceps humidiphila TaxID=1294629 RepID=A0A9P7TWI8_9HYPO|nr:hypothetical protein E4U13_007403 [Claviceps humidiphila]